MQEGLSYICGADIPVLVANVVRGGPGLGNIAPSQADYFQATRGGGHGDYYTIVLAPDSAQECFAMPKLGYELAEKYRIPVMILADGMLGQMMEPVELNYEPVDPKTLPAQDWWLTGCQGRGRRVVRSYDLGPGKLEEWNWRRWNEKYVPIMKNEQRFQATNCDDARIVVVGYGTCARICGAAVRLAREQGIKAGLLRPITLWPFPKDILAELAKKTPDMLVVEMSMGQMIEDVQLATECRTKVHFHGRPGGGIPTPNEVLEKIRAIAGGKK
jgi:2-oxoglutarate ferredoxin oxidoreductase subunit alpha